MDIKKIILIGVLLVVAVVGFFQLQRMTAPAAVVAQDQSVAKTVSTVEYVDVLVATADIPLGTRLSEEVIGWQKWPAEALSEILIDNATRPDALQEMVAAVTRTAIYQGEPILDRKVVQTGERGQMSALLGPGMRAISTRISVDTAAGGFIQPGDRVDVILTVQVQNATSGAASSRQRTYLATTIFENVNVLAIGQTYADTEGGEAYVIGSTALLELSQNDSEVLIEAQSRGDLSLTLRGLDRHRAAFPPSAATQNRETTGTISSMIIYRNGQSQHVAVQGQ